MKLKKKGFTIVELIVVMAVIAVLVLLAMPKFMGYTERAKLTELKNNIKQLENASERYYINEQDWPRLHDSAYTAEELEEFSKEIKDRTGVIVTLEETGKYYPISYEKLQKYVQKPKDGLQYIIQNPVGQVFYIDNISEKGKEELSKVPFVTPVITVPNVVIIGDTTQFISTKSLYSGNLTKVEWQLNDEEIVIGDFSKKLELGNYTIKLRISNDEGLTSPWVSKTFRVVEAPVPEVFTSGSGIPWTAEESGTYKFEACGAPGAPSISVGGYGGCVSGTKYVEAGTTLYVYVSYGGGNGASGGYQGYMGANGGGASDIRTVNGEFNDAESLESRLLVGGGGGGAGGHFSFQSRNKGKDSTILGTGNGILGYGSPGTGGSQYTGGGGGGGGGYYGGIGGSHGGTNAGGVGGSGGVSYYGGVENGTFNAKSTTAKVSITYLG